MQWDWNSRSLKLSVGELSRFTLLGAADEGSGRWRMELGSHWHQVLRDRTDSKESGWLFEQSVSGWLQQNGWQFDLRGRIDQYHPGDQPLLREIKTTQMALPADETDLRARYPHYFHQAMLYAFLLGKDQVFPQTELVFLEIQTGMTQIVVLGEPDLEALHRHLLDVVEALEQRHSHFGRLRKLVVPQPFGQWRPGQQETRAELVKATGKRGICLFEAPTGFGKTGLAIEQALCRVAAGDVDRILLLTGKNTGHAPLLKQLQAFQECGHGLAIHAFRSRVDLAIDPAMERLISHREIIDNWNASGLSAQKLLSTGILSIAEIKALGQQHGIPPWALSRMLLPYADVWIADFNYLFDPSVSPVLAGLPTYDPQRTLLIVDEAHNLPERAAASHTHLLEARTIESVLSEIQFARFSSELGRILDQLLTMVKRQGPCDELDPPMEADLIGLLREAHRALRESGFADDELSAESLEWLWNLPFLLEDWDHPHLSMIACAPAKGRILLACLDASAVVAPVLRSFSQSILMSATLRPWEAFLRELGMPHDSASKPEAQPYSVTKVVGTAPWLEGRFDVWVDTRVDTRFRQRDQHLNTTARTIGETAIDGQGCTVVFFPSYQYAEKVRERLSFHYPVLRCVVQPRNLPLEQQTEFLETALLTEDVLFLVLGSRFSEGIDALGGVIQQAIVVSPALPEVNSRQKALQKALPGPSHEAFRSVYLIPGLRKISQAVGRLVRDPSHQVRILLHGKRFMEPAYRDLLPEYLQPGGSISSDQEFTEIWLKPKKP